MALYETTGAALLLLLSQMHLASVESLVVSLQRSIPTLYFLIVTATRYGNLYVFSCHYLQ